MAKFQDLLPSVVSLTKRTRSCESPLHYATKNKENRLFNDSCCGFYTARFKALLQDFMVPFRSGVVTTGAERFIFRTTETHRRGFSRIFSRPSRDWQSAARALILLLHIFSLINWHIPAELRHTVLNKQIGFVEL